MPELIGFLLFIFVALAAIHHAHRTDKKSGFQRHVLNERQLRSRQ